MFFSRHSPRGKFPIVLSFVGTCQGDQFIKLLFALTFFHALQTSFIVFLSCLFLSLVDDFHILGLVSLISLAFDHCFSWPQSLTEISQNVTSPFTTPCDL
jgi:hypothetical protein